MSGSDGSNLTPGGGANLVQQDKVSTDLSVSSDLKQQDDFTNNNYKYFQSSNLDQPSSASESYLSASAKMPVSQGSGSGQINQNSTTSNNAQWLRVFSLIVYSSLKTAGGTVPQQGLPAPTNPNIPTPKGRVIPFPQMRGRPRPRDTAPAATPSDSQNIDVGGGGDTKQDGLDISNLRCVFSIQKTTAHTPNMLYARVYNLAPKTLAKVIEFTRVQVNAGYKYGTGYGLLFDGEVVQYRRGKETPVDTYLEIHAADGDTILNGTMAFQAYPAGTKQRKMLDDLNAKKKQLDPNFKVTYIDEQLYTAAYQRDSILIGHSRDIERKMFLGSASQHFTNNGGFVAMQKTAYLPGEVAVLAPNTGLVGLPEVTPQGIQAKCLINPKLVLGGIVQIDSNLLSAVAFTPGSATQTDANGNVIPNNSAAGKTYNNNLWRQQMETAYTSPIGQYKIMLMTYTGDTRGNPWYCDLTCVAMDSNGKAMIGGNQSNAFNRAAPSTQGKTQVE